tara:strand:+ start:685 stop:1575 length:891 start_codon:yes stop_codon:yes gene_type:complete
MSLAEYIQDDYYSGSNKGYYQYIKLADVISNFIVSQVGDDKIIKKVKRAEVFFHAQRALQELSYDTINSIKTQEIEVPPSLSMPLPHDFVGYTRILFTDESGIQRPLTPSKTSSAPSAVFQDSNYNYVFDNAGKLSLANESESASRFRTANQDTNANTDSNINFLEEGYGYNVDFGKRYGINPQLATKNGSFIIDQNNGTISFSNDNKNRIIVLEYISDGLNISDDMKIHKFAEEAIYKSISLAIISAKSNIPEYQINRLKKERRATMRAAKLRLANINIADLTQIMRGKSQQIKH